jgi:hypothetical protein
MNCNKAQQLLDDLSRDRLSEELSREVRQHLNDCTDCRVLEQRAARLQRLLALKRYEQPAAEYFGSFLNEFHGRLLTEARGRTGLWERFIARIENALTVEPGRIGRYGFAGAMAAALAISAVWMGVRQPDESVSAVASSITSISSPLTFADAALPAPHSTPKSTTATLPRPVEPTSADSALMVPPAGHVEVGAPRYVLDRIAITPASYEVATSVHF